MLVYIALWRSATEFNPSYYKKVELYEELERNLKSVPKKYFKKFVDELAMLTLFSTDPLLPYC